MLQKIDKGLIYPFLNKYNKSIYDRNIFTRLHEKFKKNDIDNSRKDNVDSKGVLVFCSPIGCFPVFSSWDSTLVVQSSL